MSASGSSRRVGVRLLSVACTIALLAAQNPAGAQAVGQKAGLAETLFQDGKALLEQGKTHEACLKFAASQREDPGLGTLLHMADCHEKEGKSASAWGEFMLATEQARGKGERDREKFAKDHAAALLKQLHKVQINAAERPPGFALLLDGESFALDGLGTALPLDPGEHTLNATAPGKKKWFKKVSIAASPGLEPLEVPALEDAPAPPPVAVVAAPATPLQGPAADNKEAPASPVKRIAGIAVGGAGLVLVGVAVYYFATASSRDKDSNDPAQIASNNSQTLHDQAKTAQTYGFITGGIGVVALGTGIFLIATSGGSSAPAKAARGVRVTPLVGADVGGLRLSGAF